MSLPLVAGIGAGLGAIGGLFSSGPDLNTYGRDESQKAYEAYRNLVGAGPGREDVTNSVNASRNFSTLLGNTAGTGLYNSAEGARLAEMQFAPQRQALAQSLQDQMAMANRAASAAGRSTNDPILRARLGAEAMRNTASLSAQQSSAAMDLGRQSTLDMLNLRGQQVNTLQGLASQAFNNQNNLFNMSSQIHQMDMGGAQYEASRGGGLRGAINGAITGVGAGMQIATGFGLGSGSRFDEVASSADSFTLPSLGSQIGGSPTPLSAGSLTSNWSGGFSSAPQFPSMPAALRAPAASRMAAPNSGVNHGVTFGPAVSNNPYMNPAFFAR